MKHIGIFVERFYPESYADAIRIKPFVDELQSINNYKLTIHTSSKSKGIEGYEVKPNFTPPPNKGGNFTRLINELILAFELLIRILFGPSYNLIIVTSPPFFVMIFCVLGARIKGIPYILDIRDIYPQVFFSLNLISEKGTIGKILSYLEKKTYEGAKFIITATKGIQKDIEDHIGEISNIKTIRNGFQEKRFQIKEKKNENFTISFHGSIARHTNVGLIIKLAKKALEEELNINFSIIGSGAKDQVFREVSLSNITYYGRLPNEETAQIISKAHLGISLRTDDYISKNSFPVKIFEYIGVGIPVIVTPISEGGEFVEKHNIGFQFSPDQKDEIFETIKRLKQEPSEINRLKKNIAQIRSQHTRAYRAKLFSKIVKNKI